MSCGKENTVLNITGYLCPVENGWLIEEDFLDGK